MFLCVNQCNGDCTVAMFPCNSGPGNLVLNISDTRKFARCIVGTSLIEIRIDKVTMAAL